jgi:hypothetical protein
MPATYGPDRAQESERTIRSKQPVGDRNCLGTLGRTALQHRHEIPRRCLDARWRKLGMASRTQPQLCRPLVSPLKAETHALVTPYLSHQGCNTYPKEFRSARALRAPLVWGIANNASQILERKPRFRHLIYNITASRRERA